jgi:acetyl esterase/lipase
MKHLILPFLAAATLQAQSTTPAAKPMHRPTQANVAYGSHERQVLDFYKAESKQPTPLLFFIHGGAG